MRIFEIAALRVDQIPPVGTYLPERHHPVDIFITKRSRPRKTWVPSFLLDETWAYIQHERRRVIAAALKRGTLNERPMRLLLNRYGGEITDEGLRERFSAALKHSEIAVGNFHDLRHTYAITMLDRLIRRLADPERGERRALLALSRLLGHLNSSTSETYLRAREIYLGDLDADDMEVPEDLAQTS
jgi:integrase